MSATQKAKNAARGIATVLLAIIILAMGMLTGLVVLYLMGYETGVKEWFVHLFNREELQVKVEEVSDVTVDITDIPKNGDSTDIEANKSKPLGEKSTESQDAGKYAQKKQPGTSVTVDLQGGKDTAGDNDPTGAAILGVQDTLDVTPTPTVVYKTRTVVKVVEKPVYVNNYVVCNTPQIATEPDSGQVLTKVEGIIKALNNQPGVYQIILPYTISPTAGMSTNMVFMYAADCKTADLAQVIQDNGLNDRRVTMWGVLVYREEQLRLVPYLIKVR